MADPEVPETDPAAAAEAAGGTDASTEDGSAGTDPAAPSSGNAAATEDPDESNDTKLTFDHQCFLMDYAHDVLSPLNAQCGYYQFHCLKPPEPATEAVTDFLARFLQREGLVEFTSMTPAQKALLQPQVRIFRVFPENSSEGFSEAEFQWPGFTEENRLSSLTSAQGGRSGGHGIKEFSWEFAGTNPAEGDKVIEVKMVLHFQSMQDLTGGLNLGGTEGDYLPSSRGGTPSPLELILHPEGGAGLEEEYDPKFYRIRAEVGWAVDGGNLENHPAFNQTLIRMLRRMQLSMFLNLVEHEIKMKEDGSMDVTVKYWAAVETTLESKAADIIFPGGESRVAGAIVSEGSWWNPFNNRDGRTIEDVNAEIQAVEETLEDIEEATACAEAGTEDADELQDANQDAIDELEELQDTAAELNDKNRANAYAAFTDQLSTKIRHLNLDNGFFKAWTKNTGNQRVPLTSDASGGVATLTIGDQGWNSNPAEEAEKAEADDVKDDDIYFCFLGDIVELACDCFGDLSEDPRSCDPSLKDMAVILGPAQYAYPRDGSTVTCSLADIPISYTLFLKFWNEKVVQPERNSYSVRSFLLDVMQCIIKPALQPKCFTNKKHHAGAQTGDVARICFSTKAEGSGNRLASYTGTNRPDLSTLTTLFPQGSINPENPGFHYMMFYMQSGVTADMLGNESDDRERGIVHYTIGQDRGLVKTIEFSKSDVQGLKEARQSEEGALANIRELYNCKVKMVGNNLHFPGQYIYVWPHWSIGLPNQRGSAAFRLGLGGYHSIIKVRSKITRGGQYDTEIEATWVDSGAGKPDIGEPDCGTAATPEDISNITDTYSSMAESAWAAINPFGPSDEIGHGDTLDIGDVEADNDDPCKGEESSDPWWKVW